ncbi:MAG: nucleotide exchange factor GrpE [Bacteroidales bacterium]|nr:nucleotide exchange factor GrpE [Bacteroidales bacterium]
MEEKINKETATQETPVNDDIRDKDAAENETTKNEASTPTEEVDKNDEEQDGKKKMRKHRFERHRDNNDEKLQEMGEKLVQLNDKYLRTMAEFENFRKRTQHEKAELLLNGGRDIIKLVLPVVDDMERALATIPEDNDAREGVQLIYNKLVNTLQSKGLKPIEAKGERFDDNIHDAVAQFPATDETQKGVVVDVVEKGYYLNDSVLRHAKVVVAV